MDDSMLGWGISKGLMSPLSMGPREVNRSSTVHAFGIPKDVGP